MRGKERGEVVPDLVCMCMCMCMCVMQTMGQGFAAIYHRDSDE
jgi:hypothetical protein